jgi:hypothetical protein
MTPTEFRHGIFQETFFERALERGRELLHKAVSRPLVVFSLEDLPVAPPLSKEEILKRRQQGPFADMRE